MDLSRGNLSKFLEHDKVLVMLVATLSNFFVTGIIFGFNQYYDLLVVEYNSSYSVIGGVGTSVSAFQCIFIPIINDLMEERKVRFLYIYVIGGTLLCLGFLISSYDTRSFELFFSFSLLIGISAACLMVGFYSSLFVVMDTEEEIQVATLGVFLNPPNHMLLSSSFINY